MKLGLAGLLLLCCWSRTVSAQAVLDPTMLSRKVALAGAASVIAMLNEDGQWDAVLAKIDEGSVPWLALAGKLAPGSDAASAEGLGISLARALPRNASGVLDIATVAIGAVSIKRVCGIPLIEQPEAETVLYQKAALKAVRRVTSRALLVKRQLCLAALNS